MNTPTDRPTLENVRRLADEAGIDIERLFPLLRHDPVKGEVRFGCVILRSSAFDNPFMKGRKVCPECLREHGRHLAVWDLSFISLCPVHRVALLDTCLSCGETLRWQGDDVTRCGCRDGGDLTRMQASRVSSEEVRATACVQGLLGDGRFALEAAYARARQPCRMMRDRDAIEFIVRIGRDAAASRPRSTPFAFERCGGEEAPPHKVLLAGVAVLEGWPERFHEVLDFIRRGRIEDIDTSLSRVNVPIVRWANSLPDIGGVDVARELKRYRRAARLGHA